MRSSRVSPGGTSSTTRPPSAQTSSPRQKSHTAQSFTSRIANCMWFVSKLENALTCQFPHSRRKSTVAVKIESGSRRPAPEGSTFNVGNALRSISIRAVSRAAISSPNVIGTPKSEVSDTRVRACARLEKGSRKTRLSMSHQSFRPCNPEYLRNRSTPSRTKSSHFHTSAPTRAASNRSGAVSTVSSVSPEHESRYVSGPTALRPASIILRRIARASPNSGRASEARSSSNTSMACGSVSHLNASYPHDLYVRKSSGTYSSQNPFAVGSPHTGPHHRIPYGSIHSGRDTKSAFVFTSLTTDTQSAGRKPMALRSLASGASPRGYTLRRGVSTSSPSLEPHLNAA